MFRNIFLTIKKLLASLYQDTQATNRLEEPGDGVQDPFVFNHEEQVDQTVLDETTANEVIATWNLINPP